MIFRVSVRHRMVVFVFIYIAQITTEVSEAGSGGGPVACPQRSRDTIYILMSVFVYAWYICFPRPLFCLVTLGCSYFLQYVAFL